TTVRDLFEDRSGLPLPLSTAQHCSALLSVAQDCSVVLHTRSVVLRAARGTGLRSGYEASCASRAPRCSIEVCSEYCTTRESARTMLAHAFYAHDLERMSWLHWGRTAHGLRLPLALDRRRRHHRRRAHPRPAAAR